MSNEKLIRAWKNPEFRSTLTSEVAPNPAGERLVEIDDAELRAVWGGVVSGPVVVSEGYVCTVSGERTGTSCWA
ncbi:MAG: hypothetical protein JWM27_3440 [Gemmatimonadetes bacterium]|nr:hypothetical protein [Gemmatimonadota bacterium]